MVLNFKAFLENAQNIQPKLKRGKFLYQVFLVGRDRVFGNRAEYLYLTPDGEIADIPENQHVLQSWIPDPQRLQDLRRQLDQEAIAKLKSMTKAANRISPFYIRFGKHGGTSDTFLRHGGEMQQAGDFDRVGEQGVSVYTASPHHGGWQVESPDKRQAIYSLGDDYLPRTLANFKNRPIFLVQGALVMSHDDGHEVATLGADGEPLLEPDTIKIVAQLSPDEVFVRNKSVEDWWDRN